MPCWLLYVWQSDQYTSTWSTCLCPLSGSLEKKCFHSLWIAITYPGSRYRKTVLSCCWACSFLPSWLMAAKLSFRSDQRLYMAVWGPCVTISSLNILSSHLGKGEKFAPCYKAPWCKVVLWLTLTFLHFILLFVTGIWSHSFWGGIQVSWAWSWSACPLCQGHLETARWPVSCHC